LGQVGECPWNIRMKDDGRINLLVGLARKEGRDSYEELNNRILGIRVEDLLRAEKKRKEEKRMEGGEKRASDAHSSGLRPKAFRKHQGTTCLTPGEKGGTEKGDAKQLLLFYKTIQTNERTSQNHAQKMELCRKKN